MNLIGNHTQKSIINRASSLSSVLTQSML